MTSAAIEWPAGKCRAGVHPNRTSERYPTTRQVGSEMKMIDTRVVRSRVQADTSSPEDDDVASRCTVTTVSRPVISNRVDRDVEHRRYPMTPLLRGCGLAPRVASSEGLSEPAGARSPPSSVSGLAGVAASWSSRRCDGARGRAGEPVPTSLPTTADDRTDFGTRRPYAAADGRRIR